MNTDNENQQNPYLHYLQTHHYTNFDIKAILFDMDGVLYNSMPHHAQSWYDSMAPLGFECTPDEFYEHEGRTGRETIDIYFQQQYGRKATKEETTEIYARKSALFSQYNKGEVMPFAPELLQKVKACSLTCVLVTGSAQRSLLDKLETDFPNIFSSRQMVTAFNVTHGKPHPEPYLRGLQLAGNLQPNQAIVVENAPVGIEAAVAAGIFTVAVNTGPIVPQRLYASGANIVLPSVQSLCENFELILSKLSVEKTKK